MFVSTSIASSAMLNPRGAVSIASTFSVLFVAAKDSCQHVPQFGESKPATANDPPMFGNPDACAKVVHPSTKCAGRGKERWEMAEGQLLGGERGGSGRTSGDEPVDAVGAGDEVHGVAPVVVRLVK